MSKQGFRLLKYAAMVAVFLIAAYLLLIGALVWLGNVLSEGVVYADSGMRSLPVALSNEVDARDALRHTCRSTLNVADPILAPL